MFKLLSVLILCGLASCSRPVDPPSELFIRLDTLLQSHSYARAVSLAQDSLNRYRRSWRLKGVLAKAHFFQGDFSQAIPHLKEMATQGWLGTETFRMLGFSYFHLGDFEEAQRWLEPVAQAFPEDHSILKTLAYTCYYLGEGAQAIQILEKIHKKDPADLEATTALDALLSLTGRWAASQLVWTTDPPTGIQMCTPGGWVKKIKEMPGPAGKVTTISFSDPPPDEEGRFRVGWVLLLSVFQNASRHPLPQVMKGSYRPGEQTWDGQRIYYATTADAQPRFETLSRDPKTLTQRLSMEALYLIPEAGRDLWVNAWTSRRGGATTCLGAAAGEDSYGNAFVGYSCGIYDPSKDIFGNLVLIGPAAKEGEVQQLSQAIFHLALFGNLVGIPPVPPEVVSAQEYQARIQGFLEGGQPARALTEAQAALQVYSGDPDLHFLLGTVRQDLGELEEAAAAYEEARRLGLTTREIEFNLGTLRLELGEPEKAQEAFSRALTLQPQDPEALSGLGLAFFRQGELDQAIGSFEEALLKAPGSEQTRFFLEAALARRQNRPTERVRWFELPGSQAHFCVPAGWEKQELQGPDLVQVLFSERSDADSASELETGLLYLRYEQASSRLGKVQGTPTPQEVAEQFLRQTFERLSDPQKLLLAPSAVGRRDADRYLTGGTLHTEGASRRVVWILSYYQPLRDRLHVLTFRAPVAQQKKWQPFAEVCFSTAEFS